ncbi:hypothetical protein [Methylotetracoccus oryzae]|uniref:hypothetical protein n=1 Tax=Methylotetracoccus oryzae TaxID=1919059 RepID=UPI001117D134|nr:hypothetical protein [Methylotetracoccus oryzae]
MAMPSERRLTVCLALVAAAAGSAGCSPVWSVDPVLLDDPLGASARHTLVAQIYDPEAAAHPDPNPVTRFDGYKANNSLQDYRLTVLQRQNIRTFSVTNSSQFTGGGGGGGGGGQ